MSHSWYHHLLAWHVVVHPGYTRSGLPIIFCHIHGLNVVYWKGQTLLVEQDGRRQGCYREEGAWSVAELMSIRHGGGWVDTSLKSLVELSIKFRVEIWGWGLSSRSSSVCTCHLVYVGARNPKIWTKSTWESHSTIIQQYNHRTFVLWNDCAMRRSSRFSGGVEDVCGEVELQTMCVIGC